MVRIPTIALLGLVALACSGSAAPGATVAITATSTRTALPTPAESPTPTVVSESPVVEDLTKRVEAVLDLASQGNWLEAWEFYTLSFRESCPKETFAVRYIRRIMLFSFGPYSCSENYLVVFVPAYWNQPSFFSRCVVIS